MPAKIKNKLERVAELFASNPTMTIDEASHVLGIATSTIVLVRRQLGLSTPRKGRKSIHRKEVLMLGDSGLTAKKISEKTGMEVSSVYRILRADSSKEKPKPVIESAFPESNSVNALLMRAW
ncbi:hypothetical protein [Endozoicomonas euniceicola]|uniref:Resolvase HTH domain-containing protein n=1 Tax=Endozoicomonas euniceicola TaxID=1234143 RepID=A0ABY6GNI9_9GAMM|nr:hypothetical protein [Endozoicomonas euniceicola]UYM14290.1 hypothetical protein NX720_15435 [Endozoicomonas euniceicola]